MMQFPGTNFHDLNLDWVIDQVKTMITEWATTREDWDELSQDFDRLRQEWADEVVTLNAWLTNNVPFEVAVQLRTMINNGEIFDIIYTGNAEHQDPIGEAVAAWLAERIHPESGYALDSAFTDPNAAAQASAVGEAVRVTLPFRLGKWERGYVTSNGQNGNDASAIRIPFPTIRNFPRKINYSIPENYRLRLVLHSSATGNWANGPWLTATGTYTFNENVDIIRMHLGSTAGETNFPLSVGDNVIITYDAAISDYLAAQAEVINPDDTDFSMVTDFGVIGDSWASGYLCYPNNVVIRSYAQSWPQTLARKSGNRVVNFSKDGLYTRSWLTDNVGLPFLLASDPLPLYIINLGINDNTQITNGTLAVGTIDDVHIEDYTQNPDTFFGNYGRIIGNIQAHAPNAKIICVSVMRLAERANMDSRIAAIAAKYGLPFIDLSQDEYFTSRAFYNAIYADHPVAYGCGGIANRMGKLICRTILSDPNYWSTYKPLDAQ